MIGGAERTSVPVVRLGEVFRLLPSSSSASSDEEQIHISEELVKQEKKVKFLTIIQGRSGVGYCKLLVSYSRQAALVDIFHEIVNAHSVLFVGAVLRDTVVPLEVQKVLSVNFRKVGGGDYRCYLLGGYEVVGSIIFNQIFFLGGMLNFAAFMNFFS
jgi:hypothetical protein